MEALLMSRLDEKVAVSLYREELDKHVDLDHCNEMAHYGVTSEIETQQPNNLVQLNLHTMDFAIFHFRELKNKEGNFGLAKSLLMYA